MYGCPQADGGGEREVPGINRKLKKKKIYIHRCHRWSQILDSRQKSYCNQLVICDSL